MPRLIDINNAYKVLTQFYNHKTDVQHVALIHALSQVPPVDAEPVRHGHWLYGLAPYILNNPIGHYECSICGEWLAGHETNYCPHCGAKMR